MKELSALNLIYHHDPLAGGEGKHGAYEVVHFFSDRGVVPTDDMIVAFQQVTKFNLTGLPVFKTVEELKEFALTVCMTLGAPEVFVLSVQDYNIGVEAARDMRIYRELFRRYGISIPNPEVIQRPGGLLGRLFQGGRKGE